MVARFLAVLVVAAAIGAAALWFASAPVRLDAGLVAAAGAGDAARGERVYHAAGCGSCHSRPGATGDGATELAGGLALRTQFGTFVAPNISSHERDGIGAWSLDDFMNAVMRGVSPDGRHYYPAFPFTSYARMRPEDVADLFAFMSTLPAVEGDAPRHQLAFPFNVRRGIGLWKRLHLSDEPVVALAADASEAARAGQYLVEGPGHCGECHTPRWVSGGLEPDRWLGGAVAAEGDGRVPNITPGEGGIGSWSEGEIVAFLETGFTPDFDSVGGSMVAVQRNMARLTAEDRAAIAAYLKAVPAVDGNQ